MSVQETLLCLHENKMKTMYGDTLNIYFFLAFLYEDGPSIFFGGHNEAQGVRKETTRDEQVQVSGILDQKEHDRNTICRLAVAKAHVARSAAGIGHTSAHPRKPRKETVRPHTRTHLLYYILAQTTFSPHFLARFIKDFLSKQNDRPIK